MSAERPTPISPPRILTERMVLRPLESGDRGAFVHYHEASREHLRPWSPRRREGMTLDEFFTEQLARSERGLREGTAVRLPAFERTPSGAGGVGAGSPKIVGMFNLNNIARGVFQCGDAGWQVSAEFVGKGYACEGVRGLLDFAFAPTPDGLGLHRIQANVIPTNAASLRVAEKCGMRREGLGVKMLMINGEWRDHVMWGKLAEENGRK